MAEVTRVALAMREPPTVRMRDGTGPRIGAGALLLDTPPTGVRARGRVRSDGSGPGVSGVHGPVDDADDEADDGVSIGTREVSDVGVAGAPPMPGNAQ